MLTIKLSYHYDEDHANIYVDGQFIYQEKITAMDTYTSALLMAKPAGACRQWWKSNAKEKITATGSMVSLTSRTIAR